MIEGAKKTGTDRIELYTEAFGINSLGNQNAIEPYIAAAVLANDFGINAGHDLSLDNIQFLNKTFPVYSEVSIGHLITESLYLGLENVVNMYLQN
jgi:pyridoxine 5-phosphate synthase